MIKLWKIHLAGSVPVSRWDWLFLFRQLAVRFQLATGWPISNIAIQNGQHSGFDRGEKWERNCKLAPLCQEMLRGFQELRSRASGAHSVLRETRKSVQFDHPLASVDVQSDNMPRWLPNTFGEQLNRRHVYM